MKVRKESVGPERTLRQKDQKYFHHFCQYGCQRFLLIYSVSYTIKRNTKLVNTRKGAIKSLLSYIS